MVVKCGAEFGIDVVIAVLLLAAKMSVVLMLAVADVATLVAVDAGNQKITKDNLTNAVVARCGVKSGLAGVHAALLPAAMIILEALTAPMLCQCGLLLLLPLLSPLMLAAKIPKIKNMVAPVWCRIW